MNLPARLALFFLLFAFALAPAFCPADAGAAGRGKSVSASKGKSKKAAARSEKSGKAGREKSGTKGKSRKKAEKSSGRQGEKSQRAEKKPETVRLPERVEIWSPSTPGTMQHGKASWYGSDFHGGPTASGLAYDMHTFTAAHRTLPIGTVVKVTDKDNGKSVMVCVTDRGPFVPGRIIDLSYAAADQLDLADGRGVGTVAIEVISDDSGRPLAANTAYYVSYMLGSRLQEAGPFESFADAAAMHEAIRQVHPEAELIVDDIR